MAELTVTTSLEAVRKALAEGREALPRLADSATGLEGREDVEAIERALNYADIAADNLERFHAETRDTVPSEERELLWQAILDKVTELTVGRNSSRSMGYYAESGRYVACRCIVSVHGDDGTSTVYDLEATRNTAWPAADEGPGAIDVRIQTYRDDHDAFWAKQLAEHDQLTAIVDHVRYQIVRDPGPGKPDHCRGFGGREHTIEFFDGRTVTTRNLWTQGTIPPAWRDRLPDNARWAQPSEQQGGGESRD